MLTHIHENLALGHQVITSTTKVMAPSPTHHILVIDCSGSMYSELELIRKQLKQKLPTLLGEKDTVSVIWFSGRSQYGMILEGETVATLADLARVNSLIDRWLKAIGLTGFKEPLEEVPRLIARLASKFQGYAYNLLFLSDGYDNAWPKSEILDAVAKVAPTVTSSTFVEYGYYADRNLLTAMAEKCGGSLVFSKDFVEYDPTLSRVLTCKVASAAKVEVVLEASPIGAFAFALKDGEIVTYSVTDQKVLVPEDTKELFYLVSSPNATPGKPCVEAIYAALALYSQRMKSDVVLQLLTHLQDVSFVKEFGGCFGKQRYSAFMQRAKSATFDAKLRGLEGYADIVPPPDAFTVLDLLRILAEDHAELLLNHESFQYKRISRGTVDAASQITPEEQAEIDQISESIKAEKDPKRVLELTAKIQELVAAKKEPLKFVPVGEQIVPISSLVYNEERPNISILTTQEGVVLLPDVPFNKVPKEFPTRIYRNYAIIKDGIVNVPYLPVRMKESTYKRLVEAGLSPNDIVSLTPGLSPNEMRDSYTINIERIPVINRNMVKDCSAKQLLELEFKLLKSQAAQKVYNAIRKEKFPKTSESFEVLYGKEATEWLKDLGIKDYGGFSPKQVQADATDFYMAKELKVSLKGYSTLPSMAEFKKQAAKGKLNGPATLMAPFVAEVDAFLLSDAYTKAKKPDVVFEAWLTSQNDAYVAETRALIRQLAQIKFTIIVGQIWPTEFASLDENTLNVTVDGVPLQGKLELREVKVDI